MFADHKTTETTSTLGLRQKVKRDKLAALYRHLNVTGDPDLVDRDQFKLRKKERKKKSKTGKTSLLFLTAETGNHLRANAL